MLFASLEPLALRASVDSQLRPGYRQATDCPPVSQPSASESWKLFYFRCHFIVPICFCDKCNTLTYSNIPFGWPVSKKLFVYAICHYCWPTDSITANYSIVQVRNWGNLENQFLYNNCWDNLLERANILLLPFEVKGQRRTICMKHTIM